MKKIYIEPKTVMVNVAIENLLQATSRSLQVNGSQSNESALGRRGDFFDDDED